MTQVPGNQNVDCLPLVDPVHGCACTCLVDFLTTRETVEDENQLDLWRFK